MALRTTRPDRLGFVRRLFSLPWLVSLTWGCSWPPVHGGNPATPIGIFRTLGKHSLTSRAVFVQPTIDTDMALDRRAMWFVVRGRRHRSTLGQPSPSPP
ncbi:hypothetical protein B0T18DRAFT_409915 [Schizothecium vesticola]|uniref:Uncharacterized protein n=1 Tax=Schizothecium vesticola TaxID=314040 RepID=A0AA40EU57_9PEZI|nr:hypothetical protein B0T18DRAFT_409915 [Schizothecium vesticola]